MPPNPAQKVPKTMSMPTNESSPTNEKSGKRLILGVIAACVVAAAISWWFRYQATRRVVQFWGAETAVLIRDAKHVTLRSDAPSADGAGGAEADVPRDISSAKGMTHLRTNLLEDSSYQWDSAVASDIDWANSLVFAAAEGGEPRAVVIFSKDFRWISNGSAPDPGQHVVATTGEFAAGLKEFFASEIAAPAEQ
jgi:hypothetical protein